MKNLLLVTIGWITLFTTVFGQTNHQINESLTAEINVKINEFISKSEPGASIVVVKKDEVVFKGSYGLADVEKNKEVTDKDQFCIASVSKHFTALAILSLVDEGKLSLSDDIRKHLPNLPVGDRVVTIRQLLSHTNGLPELTQNEEFMTHLDQPHTPVEIFNFVSKEEFRYEPGEKWMYTNTGYTVSVALIEKLSGSNFSDYMKNRFFKPLGMSSTFIPSVKNDGSSAVGRYYLKDKGFIKAPYMHFSNLIGGGNVITTADDMVKWGLALLNRTRMPKTIYELWNPNKLINGESTEYGLGLGVDEQQGHKVYYHPGQGDGMNAMMYIFPDDDLFIMVMRNIVNPKHNSQEIGEMIAGLVLED